MGVFSQMQNLGFLSDTSISHPQTVDEELQDQENKKYKDRPADKEMAVITNSYLKEQEDRNVEDRELMEKLNTVAERWTNANPKQFIKDRIKYPMSKVLQRRGEAELLRQEALTNAPSYIRDNVLEATPTALKTYVDKVVLKNRDDITEKDFKSEQIERLDEAVADRLREGIAAGIYFLNPKGELKSMLNQEGVLGSKSNKDTGYSLTLRTEMLDEDIFHTIGSSGVAIRKEKPTYNIFDKYDFAFKFAGKPTPRGFNKDNIKQYRLADKSGRQEASYSTRDWRGKKLLNYALPAAERYGAGQLPDELTATQLSNLEGKEVKPESVNINIGSALNIDENEWAELMEQATTNRDNIDSWINDRYSKVEDSLLTPVKVQGN